MTENPSWTMKELQKIDKQYMKARDIEQEASDFKKYNYDLCVRRSQEAFELFLKVVFKLMREEYPTNIKGHELSNQIMSTYEKLKFVLKDYHFPKEDIVRIIIGSKVFHLWRNISLYGEEKLEKIGISKIFTEKEAEIALDYLNKASRLCNLIRSYFYKVSQESSR